MKGSCYFCRKKAPFTKKFLCGLAYLCEHEGTAAGARRQNIVERSSGQKEEEREEKEEEVVEQVEVMEDPAGRLSQLSRLCAAVYFTLFKDLLA